MTFEVLITIAAKRRIREQAVWVIHARHGRQLTRSKDLPDDIGSIDEDS